MANPLPINDPVAREFVDCVLAEWNGALGFAPGVLAGAYAQLGGDDFVVGDGVALAA